MGTLLMVALAVQGGLGSGVTLARQVPGVPFVLTGRALDVVVDYAGGSLAGTETLHLRNVTQAPAGQVPLLLNRLMSVSSVTDPAGATRAFRQDIVLFEDDPLLQVDAVEVHLPRPVAAGDSVSLVVRYGGHLVGYTETGSLYIQDRVDHDFTILRQDAYAFPALGVPSRRANRTMGYDAFDFSVRVTVPEGLVVATGGEAAEPTRRDSLVTWSYHTVTPAPFMAIEIAPYEVLSRPGLHVFYFPQDSTGAHMVDRAVAGAMARYTDWYGALAGDPQVTVIEIPEMWGSQASLAGGIIQTADAFRDRGQLYQLYHELSHLWNPNDLDRPSPRWNEGLAMFLQWRVAGELDGWTGWDARLDRAEQILKSRCAPPRPCGTVPFARYGQEELTDLSYTVGQVMFYALYRTLGPDAFDRAYRDYFGRYRDTGGTAADLIATFHRVDPASDQIFRDWYATTTWFDRLGAGESVRRIVEGYARPGAGGPSRLHPDRVPFQ
jgi:hypothetical protein